MPHNWYDITLLEPLIEEGFVLLTPNARLARRIGAQWNAQQVASGKRVWEPARVQPMESWLQEQWERAVRQHLLPPLTPLTAAQTAEIWRQVIAEYGDARAEFQLLSPTSAVDLASRARDTLQRWRVDVAQRSVRQLFELDQDCRTFLAWAAEFEQRLKKLGACTATDCLVQLSDGDAIPAEGRVALVDIADIPPLHKSLLEQLAVEVRSVEPGNNRAQCNDYAFADKRAELQGVASWAAQMQRQEPASTIGIVLSDMSADRLSLEYLLRREFGCLGENYISLPVNFSAGIPLAQVPIVRDALKLLALLRDSTTVPEIVDLLRSRYAAMSDAVSPLANKFVARLHKQGRLTPSVAQLRVAATAISLDEERGLELGQHLLAIFQQRELKTPCRPSQWVERFTAVLTEWGWPGNQTLDSLEFQQLKLWYQTLDQFRALDAVCAPLQLDDVLRLLRTACEQQVSQPQTLDSPVQVLGPLEAAGLNFDHLWVTGMQASKWPAAPRPNPFIPIVLQTREYMPHATAEREWDFAATLWAQYARSSAQLHASYYRQSDGVPERKSALLAGFGPGDLPVAAAIPDSWLRHVGSAAQEHCVDDRAPPLQPAALEQVKGGSGLLEDQSQCPFRAFARRRLLVEPLGEFSIALSPGERGSLLHDALYALWGEIGDHGSLLALDEAGQSRAVAVGVGSALAAVPSNKRQQLGQGYWHLEEQRLRALLLEWLAIERERSEFCVELREADIVLELAHMPIRLRVDRVDRLPDGSRVIIDYKSGSSRVQQWLGERPERPQLLLYGIAAPGEAAALAFAQVKARNCRYVGLGQVAAAPGISTDIEKAAGKKVGANDWQSLNEYWRATLEGLAQAFVDGRAAVDPLGSSSCTWCGLQPLCRVEHSVDAQREPGL